MAKLTRTGDTANAATKLKFIQLLSQFTRIEDKPSKKTCFNRFQRRSFGNFYKATLTSGFFLPACGYKWRNTSAG
jgi:hypothetical protein